MSTAAGADDPIGRVQAVGLHKAYGDVVAVNGIDLDVAGGEFFSLLGPSGCGKTTTLRMIAGFESPTAGAIRIDGQDMSRVPASGRPVNTVFQNYALFPFMTVEDNVAFGLRYQRSSKSETRRRVGQALELVRMGSYAGRRPAQLSGGQQQRVALARAIVLNPRVLLLDEPLGALDAKLRKTLQLELKSLQESLRITFVYVTHDQEEALTMSDRLAVMASGQVEQVGTPQEVYESPATAYVADFLGSANVLDVPITRTDEPGMVQVRIGSQVVSCPSSLPSGQVGRLVVRPERLRLDEGAAADHRLHGRVIRTVYQGATIDVRVALEDGSELVVRRPSGSGAGHADGDDVTVYCPVDAARVLPTGALETVAG
jgi:spermidine/putrescine transport system ATP-binding protein